MLRKKQRLREKREANGRKEAFDEVLRELEMRVEQYRPAYGRGDDSRLEDQRLA